MGQFEIRRWNPQCVRVMAITMEAGVTYRLWSLEGILRIVDKCEASQREGDNSDGMAHYRSA